MYDIGLLVTGGHRVKGGGKKEEWGRTEEKAHTHIHVHVGLEDLQLVLDPIYAFLQMA